MDNTPDDSDDSCPENQAVKGFAPVITSVITHDDSWKNDDSSNDSQSKTPTNKRTVSVSVTPDDSDDSSDSEIKVGSRGSHNNPMHVRNGDSGTIEGKRDFNGDWIVRWDTDGENQRNVA